MCTEIIESSGDGPPHKRQHLDDSISTASTSKVWECMVEILEDSGELTDDVSIMGEMGEIKGMVNTYLREPLINYQVGNPY